MQQAQKLNAVRKSLLWWFDWPGNPFVTVSGAIDFSYALDYLEQINGDPEQDTVTVHHLVAAALARLLTEYPRANARIVGKKIIPVNQVGIAMPVNLLGVSGAQQEVGMALVEEANTLSLRAIAATTRARVRDERSGQNANPLIRLINTLGNAAPYPLLAALFNLVDHFSRIEAFARLLFRVAPFTTVLSNAGAAFGRIDGTLFRAAAMEVPQRIFHVGTVWGISALQDEVLAIGGVPVVRPVLPLAMVFDHRLFDGVMAGKLLVRLSEILREPESFFGPSGTRPCGRGA